MQSPRRPRLRLRTLLGSLTALLVALPMIVSAAPAAQAAVSIDWVVEARGLNAPTQVTSAGDGTGRLFVAEKAGVVRVVTKNGTVRQRPFLDIQSLVKDDGEGGLLSIAFHPRYRSHPFVWVAFTNNSNDVTVRRFRAPTYRANHVLPSTGHGVITVSHPDEFTNHYGGQLAFGRTGLLFMTTGDGGGGGDPFDHAQDRSTLQGKMLRLKVVGARAACGDFYCVPRSNPFAGKKPGRGEIWATGLRNAWRFSVDPATGDLWVGDVGQGAFEEVDRVPAGVGGRNLGWSCREGFEVFDESRCRPGARYLDPVIAYGRNYGTTVTGGFVYRGSRYAALLGGQYVAGDFGSGRVFHLEGTTRHDVATRLEGVTSFGEDDARELWAVTISGQLLRMRAS